MVDKTNEILIGKKVSEFVELETFIASEVNLRLDLWRVDRPTNHERIKKYVPTKVSREALKDILERTSASKENQIQFITGTYGTGKSYLLLVLANLLGRADQGKDLEKLIHKINKEESRYNDGLIETIERTREAGNHLVVIPNYAEQDFKPAMLEALRRALEQEGIDYRPETQYQHVLELIEKWDESNHPVIDNLREQARSDNTTLNRLKSAIRDDYEKESLRKLESYYKEYMGVDIPYDNISIQDTYEDVHKVISKDYGYSGISILFDEFGKFIEECVNRPDAFNSLIIQDFIESVKKSPGTNISLVFAAHRSVRDYAKGNVNQKDIDKVSGRFDKTHRLRVSSKFDEAEEMISNTIVRKNEGESSGRVVNKKIKVRLDEDWKKYLSNWYPDWSKEWREETIAKGCYPLHPATVRVLPLISDRMGQSTRTMFRYMSPEEDGGVSSFIHDCDAFDSQGRLQLLTIDELYDYFVGSIDVPQANRLNAAQVKRRYERAEGSIQVDDKLAKRLLKALAILRVVNDEQFQSTADNLIWALNLTGDEVKKSRELLRVLSEQGAVRKNPATGIYKFRGAGEVSVKRIHQEHLQEVDGLSASEEKDIYSTAYDIRDRKIEPIKYNDQHLTNRKAAQSYILKGEHKKTIKHWIENLSDIYKHGEGNEYEGNIVIIRLLAKNEAEKEDVLEYYSELNEEIKKYFLIGSTIIPSKLTHLANKYSASKKTLNDERVQKSDEMKEEAQYEVTEYRDAIEEEMKKIIRPKRFEWRYKSDKYDQGEIGQTDLEEYVENIISSLFSCTPKISNDTIQHYTESRDSHKKVRRQAMDVFLDPNREGFKFKGSSQTENMVEGLVKPNEMYEYTGRENNRKYYVLKRPPEGSAARDVWNTLAKHLCKEGVEANLLSAVRDLYSAPYGLSHPAVEMFLAAFIGYHGDEFTLREGKRGTPLDGQNLGKARSRPDKYSLRYQVLAASEKRYLKELVAEFGAGDETLTDVWKDTADALFQWYEDLPPVTKNLAQGSNVEGLFESLRRYSGSTGDRRKAAKFLLSEDLPQEFDFDSEVIEEESSKDKILADILQAKQDAESFVGNYADRVLVRLANEAFGQTCSGSREFSKIVEEWLSDLSTATRLHFKNEGDRAGDFLQHVAKEGDIVELFLVNLPNAWEGMRPYKKWSDRTEKVEYIQSATKVVQQIQDHQASPVPLLSRISQRAFEEKIENEAEFKEVVVDWVENLDPERRQKLKNGNFSPRARVLRDAIAKLRRAEGSAVDHFLKYVPQELDIVGGKWPNIPQPAQNKLVAQIEETVEEVKSWEPPLSTKNIVEKILENLNGDIWNVEETSNPERKMKEVSKKWYESLPPSLKVSEFDGVEAEILLAIKDENFGIQQRIEINIPDIIGVAPPSKAESAVEGKLIVSRITKAFQVIDDWERPVEDLIKSLERHCYFFNGAENTSQITLRVSNWWDDLEQKPRSTSDIKDDPVASLLAKWGRDPLHWGDVFPKLISIIDVNTEFGYWDDCDDEKFGEAIDAARERLERWEPSPPSDEKIRSRVSEALNEVMTSMNIERSRLMSVVSQIMED